MNHPDEPTQAMPADEIEAAAANDDPTVESEATAVLDTDPRRGPSPLVWLVAGVLVLALIGGIVWFTVTTTRQNREAAMRDTALAYYNSVAGGMAAEALELLAVPPANTALLTDAVLAASNEAAPLTDIRVGALGGTDDAPTVEVTYQLGDSPVTTWVPLVAEGSNWRITDGTVDLTVPERRALTVNGVELTEEVNPVFPGSYLASPVSDKVALAGEPTALVTDASQEGARIEVTVGLSELGTQTVLNTVKGRFDECLASTESRPANCPFGVSTDGVEVTPGSVRFTLVNDPWAGFAPTLDPATLVASGTFNQQLTATATVSRDGLTTDATTALNNDRGYAVDLTKDPATVSWS